jgi:hypothetical protein
VNGFMSRVLADRVPRRPDQAELHEAVAERPVKPLGGGQGGRGYTGAPYIQPAQG